MFIPPSCIDTLYDYLPLLKDTALCDLPETEWRKEIAVIGSGAAGMVVAHELLKMGLNPIIYEANNRMGGRLYSQPFTQIQADIQPFAEMGAMRIPCSSRIFFHYADKIKLHYGMRFPHPGAVKTTIYFQDKKYDWIKKDEPPQLFSDMKLLLGNFVRPLIKNIQEAWKQGDLKKVRNLWQININQYKHLSLYQALHKLPFPLSNEQINLFGALGLGYGGYNPVFQISSLEMLRILVNGYANNQIMIQEGTTEFIDRLYHLKVQTPFGITSLAQNNAIRLNSSVVRIDYNRRTNNPIIIIKERNNTIHEKEYPAVIFSGSLCAAHLINLSNKTTSGVYLLGNKVREAIKNPQFVASSKTFICTKTKFWLEKKLPTIILTDDLSRATYFLDYPSIPYGVVCLSYSWGMDAMKLHSVDPKDRIVIFKRVLAAIHPQLDTYLQPLNNEILAIDWINEKYQNGAFKLLTPGNDPFQKELYFQFQSVLTEEDKGLYLAGDGISWSGGWVEGALYTGLNAAFAVAKRMGAKIGNGSPLEQDQNLYTY